MTIICRKGSTGENVRNLQEMLNFLSAAPQPLIVDGLFGPKTDARVHEFQKESHLSADGIVGPLTARALIAGVLEQVYSQ